MSQRFGLKYGAKIFWDILMQILRSLLAQAQLSPLAQAQLTIRYILGRSKQAWGSSIIAGIFILALVISVAAQSPTPRPAATPASITNKTLKIATRVLPPFVTEENGQLSGFSIDLWNKITEEMKVRSEFQKTASVKDILAAVQSGKADMGVGAISVTAQRERDMDFSQPIFDSGLQILVKSQGSRNSVWRLLSQIFTQELLHLFGIMMIIILIPGHIVWLVERKHKGGFLQDSAYFPGIFKTFWWAASTLATQAEEMPKGPLGRIIAVLWMFISVVFIAYFTATVTTSLTVEQLQTNIKGVNDLPGKTVATVADSTSAKYLQQQQNISVKTFPKIDEAYAALNSTDDLAKVDAIVYDSPILLYYAAHEGKGKVQIVGNVFRKENYAIAMPNGSPYRKEVNSALLSVQEKGGYQEIYDKWFSSK
jgi:polar amino acid transport system substrate-binding protein